MQFLTFLFILVILSDRALQQQYREEKSNRDSGSDSDSSSSDDSDSDSDSLADRRRVGRPKYKSYLRNLNKAMKPEKLRKQNYDSASSYSAHESHEIDEITKYYLPNMPEVPVYHGSSKLWGQLNVLNDYDDYEAHEVLRDKERDLTKRSEHKKNKKYQGDNDLESNEYSLVRYSKKTKPNKVSKMEVDFKCRGNYTDWKKGCNKDNNKKTVDIDKKTVKPDIDENIGAEVKDIEDHPPKGEKEIQKPSVFTPPILRLSWI